MRKSQFLLVSILFLSSQSQVWAFGKSAHVGPSDALKSLVEGNNEFVSSHDSSYFESYQTSQHPFVTLVTCSDARVHVTALLKDPMDKMFVIRNIGNQLVVSHGSIDYGVLHLHTPILLILGHTHCGAIKAAMGDYRKETESIRNELDHLHLSLLGDKGEGDFENRWLKNVEHNVDWQVDQALSFYHDLVQKGELVVVGAVYDFINAYGKGYGRMVIINVNGMTDPNAIKKHSVTRKLSDKIKNSVVGVHH